MNELVLVPLDKSHLTVLQVWFKDSESQWVDEPSAQFVDYVSSPECVKDFETTR